MSLSCTVNRIIATILPRFTSRSLVDPLARTVTPAVRGRGTPTILQFNHRFLERQVAW